MTETQLRYATKRIVELESLLLVDVTETVWPAEVGMVFGQIEMPGISRRITSAALSTTLTACGWRKCRYRPSSPRPGRWLTS